MAELGALEARVDRLCWRGELGTWSAVGPLASCLPLLPADPDSRLISATARGAKRFPRPLFVGEDACSAPGFMCPI